jgi:pimeloyl-ACP methyl ester carboxylesterase
MIQLPHLAALAVVALSPLGHDIDESQNSATDATYGVQPAAISDGMTCSLDGTANDLDGSEGLFLALSSFVEPTMSAAAAPSPSPSLGKAKYEEVEIKTQDKQAISGSFYASKKSGRAPAVLLVHDAGSDRTIFDKVASSLQKRGFAVLSIDLRGHGSSVTESYNWIKASDEDHSKMWAFAMRDLDASTGFLRKRDDVHNSNLSLVGVGAGAALAVKYALRDENARAVVLVDPQPEAFGYDMYQDVFELGGLPTMIMAPKADRKQADRLQVAATKGNDGIEYVDVKVLKPKDGKGPLTDKRLPKEVSDFLRDEAMPGRK